MVGTRTGRVQIDRDWTVSGGLRFGGCQLDGVVVHLDDVVLPRILQSSDFFTAGSEIAVHDPITRV